MMQDTETQRGRLHRLTSNQSLILNDPSRVWVVRRGRLEVLSTRLHNHAPTGMRRYLFPVTPRRAAFGSICAEEYGHLGLIGVVSGETEVIELEWEQIAARLKSPRRTDTYLETWVEEITRWIVKDTEAPSTTVRVTDAKEQEMHQDDVLAADFRTMLLCQINAGEIAMLGREDMVLTPKDGTFLASPKLWFRVVSDTAAISACPLSSPDADQGLRAGLATLHRLLHRDLAHLAEAEELAEIKRRKDSRELRELETAAAFHNLSAVLDPIERFPLRETKLLTALSVVGQVMGIQIKPPAASEDMSKVNEEIEAIARASRVHWRKVTLGAEWWTRDSGPLLGVLGEEKRLPVALLPKGGTYDIVDPDVRYRQPLTPTLRAQLCADAYMLYRPLPTKMSGVWDLLRFTARGRVRDTLAVLLCGLCATLLGMITPKVTGALVDTAIPNASKPLIYEFGVILFVAGLATALFTYVQLMTTVRVSTTAELTSQSAMWARLLKFRPNFFRTYSSGDLQLRVNAVGEVNRDLNGATMRPLISGLLALLNFFLLWYYSWTLAKIAIWVGVLVLLLTLIVSYFVRHMSFRLHDLQGNFHGLMVQMIGGVGKLRVAGAEHRAFNHWVTEYTPQLHLMRRIQLLKDLVTTCNLNMPTIALGFLFWKAAKLTVGLRYTDPDYISIGDFIAFNTAFTLYLTGWTDVSDTFVGVLDSIVKGRRIKPILDAEPEVADDAADPGRLQGLIKFENVSFRYIENGPLILDDVSFEINPGEFVAFVGPSGSGKSTILRLLLGFDRPEYGRILYDGQDLSGLDVLAVRRQIGVVIQNGRLNAGSIIDNVSNNAKLSHAEIWDALASAGMNDDVEKMPMGLHTVVAEGGVNFSGGQRQRLLIARALATRPHIVFFDEATSALDNKTQAIVTETLERRKVTRVVIAHRLSTIRTADRIYVIDRGRVMQSGTFDELSQQDGVFKDLISRQIL
jgi:ATP-binding cassette subfamily C protein